MAVAAPAAPAAPDIAGEMAAASADYEAKRAPLAAELAAKVAPAQDAAIQSAEELSKLAEQKPALAPLPKNMAQHIDPKVMSDTAQIFMTMGALFGLASRQPMTAVLGNMTAAMKGVQAGDAAQYDKAMEEYKTNFDAAMKTNKAMLDEQRRALENKNMSLSARLQEMKIIEAKYGGPLRGVDESFKRTMELYKSRINAITKAETANAVVLKAEAAVAKARHGGAGGVRQHGTLALTDAQNEALFGKNGAVPTGKLDPNRINSRTAGLLADAFIKNPNTDFAKFSADIALMRNPTFRQRAMTASTLESVMKNMVAAGKKLDYSDVKAIGLLEQWKNGQLNDPDFVKYMAQRNDALLSIAGVMRGVGMTDQAHRAEIEAASPVMSPRALDAWLEGQMESLKPRMEQYDKFTREGANAGGAATKPQPTAKDREYAKKSPELAAKFKAHFGVDP